MSKIIQIPPFFPLKNMKSEHWVQISNLNHTCKNLIPMIVTRAMANSSKNHAIIGHQRKSPFCTFSCINPGFGRPWDMLRKKKNYCHFHNASKKCLWSKNFLNFMHGFKSAFLAKLKNCQNGTFEPVHEIGFC